MDDAETECYDVTENQEQHLQLIQATVKWLNFSGSLIINENLHFYKQI